MTTESSINIKYVRITTNQQEKKSNPNPNPNHNPNATATKQHALVFNKYAYPEKFIQENVIARFYYLPLSLYLSRMHVFRK